MRQLVLYLRLRFCLFLIWLKYSNNISFECDIAIVLPPEPAQGWILDAIGKEVFNHCSSKSLRLVRYGDVLPCARRYFFTHYMYLVGSILSLKVRNPRDSGVFATHLEPEKHKISTSNLSVVLNNSKQVFCMNSRLIDELTANGVVPQKLVLAIGAADPDIFRSHKRSADGRIGFCSAFYSRKNPALLLEICKKITDKNIVLVGRGWEKFAGFGELLSMPNFEYIDSKYEDYPAIYATMSVFVSVSEIEGGPIPLLEAMFSNVVPVVSDTGFAQDIIEQGKNGYVFNLKSATVDEIADLISQAQFLSSDIRKTVVQYGWKNFSEQILYTLLK